ncbi:transglutaminase domain-containing protein [Kordia sp.]|uniref:transglutaminase domain-containing protein n=1 Tax=Kordia sp. TaxID=1965332 RepID=UPI003D2ABCB5
MKSYILIIFVLLNSSILNAQDFEFGNVSKAEIEETQHPREADANAAILYNNRKTFFEFNNIDGWRVVTEITRRIKIYTKDGVSWATHEVPLYQGSRGDDEISAIKGYTYNLVNGKIQKTKLKRDGIFDAEINKYWNKKTMTFPNVKDGSVIEYKYRLVDAGWTINDVEIQYSIPVNKTENNIRIPKYFYYKRNSKGYFPVKFNETKKNRNLIFPYKAGSTNGYSRMQTKNGTVTFYENIYEINTNNVPAVKEESYIHNIRNYATAIAFELASFERFGGERKNYNTSWEKIVERIYKLPSFGNELDKDRYFRKDLDILLQNATSESEKIAVIFNHVKTKVKWNGYYGYLTDKGVKNAYKEGIGNVADINLMLTAMFRHAGISANPVLVSTRNNGIPLFPTSKGFNYVISAVEINNGLILFDATEIYATPNVLPERAINWIGRIVRKDGSSAEVDLTPQKHAAKLSMYNFKIGADGVVEGQERSSFSENRALTFRKKYSNISEDEYLEKLENDIEGIEIEEYTIKDEKNLGKPVTESYKFTLEDRVEIIGDKIYFSPMLFLATTENPFKADTREYPIDYNYLWSDTYRITIEIPEGYEIESIPKSLAMAMEDNLGEFKYMVSQTGNRINVSTSVKINTLIIPSMYYGNIKEFYKMLVEKEQEKVVLKKI